MDFDSEVCDNGTEADSDSEELYLAHQAAARGDTNLLVRAIQRDPSVIEQQDGDSFTPLSHAVRAEQMGAMKRLIKMGADVNARDGQGRTCLATAAYQGWYDGVMYLLRKGAKQNISDKTGRTPLHASTYDKDIRVIGALLQKLSMEEVNQADNERMTSLHWAAFHDRPEHVQMLIMHGGDMTYQDVDNKTSLHWAAQKGSAGSCQILLQCAKNPRFVNVPDSSGKTAVHYAAAAGNFNILEQLAKVTACELECEDPDDRTPLHWATAMGHSHCVSLLLRLKVTPNPIDIEGGTPLDYAQQSGHKECQGLLEKALGIKHNTYQESSKAKPWKNPPSDKSTRRGNVRNPIWKLKDLFRPRHKKSSTGTPTSSDTTNTSDSIEMKTLVPDSASSSDTSGRSRVRKNSIELRTQRLTQRSTQDKPIISHVHNQRETTLTLLRDTAPKPVVRRTMTIPIPILTVSLADDDDEITPIRESSALRPVMSARAYQRSARSIRTPMSSLVVEHAMVHREKENSDSDNSPKASPPRTSPPKSSLHKGSPPRPMVIPKIVLSMVTDLEDPSTSLNQRRQNRMSARKGPRVEPVRITIPTQYMTSQAIGVPVSPISTLPPVMSPRVSPLSTTVLGHAFPKEHPNSKKKEELAPLRIPASPVPIPLRMQGPTSPAGFLGRYPDRSRRSPTPPPTIKLWPSDESIQHQHSPNLSPSPLQFDSDISEKIRRSVTRRLSGFSEKSSISRRLSGLSEASQFLMVDERDRFGGSGPDMFSLSSGSRLSMHSGSLHSASHSPIPPGRGDAQSIQLTPLSNSYGSNAGGTLLCASPVPMTSMEKKSMDRSIQSLLH